MTLKEFEAGLRKEHERRAKIAEEKRREKRRIETEVYFGIMHEHGKRYWRHRRRDGKW